MGLTNATKTIIPAPSGSHTLCFNTFGPVPVMAGHIDLNPSEKYDQSTEISITTKGHHCLKNENKMIQV